MALSKQRSRPVALRDAAKLRLYRSIATMDKKAPLPPLRNQAPNWSQAAALVREWQLNKLAERLEALASNPSPQTVKRLTR